MLELQGISKTFFPGTVNERVALAGVDLTMNEGDFVTVIGSNGAGKSTLLNALSGKLRVDSGKILLDGTHIGGLAEHARARFVGRVFQDPMAGTAPDLTIEQNLALAYRRGATRGLSLGLTRGRREHFAEQLARLELGLEHRLRAKVGLLSGGQRQALSLLMASFTNPRVLLLDEHTAALDPQRAAQVTQLTRDIVSSAGLTTLMVTHNMQQALDLGNRLIMMHDGRIILELSADEKAQATVDDLLGEFGKIKGAELDDRTMLQ
ncbi:ABC transporter ATP-binding protein [Pseudoclavibacter endophyticus]|uniref:ABC transporter ATP-binding protein n=1 Tax=Pseudoclavibacter endophyticus TaxID=1778590 RepID=A0A6H9WLU2_9MICO|nr:ABC transporter ATP-binding protein [Pseudoclavibacter endophyticus]KAB1649796.1 ABC transporter ATP-binding protein [Pseudoclavibacter endophyticus]GGA59684.1 ABC transporter ATP-binding protein [Pseudoclavibacter endophyticus]